MGGWTGGRLGGDLVPQLGEVLSYLLEPSTLRVWRDLSWLEVWSWFFFPLFVVIASFPPLFLSLSYFSYTYFFLFQLRVKKTKLMGSLRDTYLWLPHSLGYSLSIILYVTLSVTFSVALFHSISFSPSLCKIQFKVESKRTRLLGILQDLCLWLLHKTSSLSPFYLII